MKTKIKYSSPVPALLAGVALGLSAKSPAQTFNVLHTFQPVVPDTDTNSLTYRSSTNADGSYVVGPLVVSNNTLYGAARQGGSGARGTVFRLNTDGTGFTTLYSFSPLPSNNAGVNSDGGWPDGVVLSSNTLYGVTEIGGQIGAGTVFSVNTDGTGFTDLQDFNLSDNNQGKGVWALSNGTLYVTSRMGGSEANGEVFAVSTDGTTFATLYTFSGPELTYGSTNSDGALPNALVLLNGVLYGTAGGGGPLGGGTVFALNTDGTGFTDLHSFAATPRVNPLPRALTGSGGVLYGAASDPITMSDSIFAMNADGTGFTNIYSLTDGSTVTGLILSANTLYGTVRWGGPAGAGSIFALKTDGTGFMVLHAFTATSAGTNSDGANPVAALILAGDTLYGSAPSGGDFGAGTVFSISFPPRLTITPSGPNVVVTWPTNYAGFDYTGYSLQSSPNLGPSAVWVTNSTAPVVINGYDVVTNPISGTEQFYRLTQ